MKKKIISLLLISICGLLVSCDCDNKDKVNRYTKDNASDNSLLLQVMSIILVIMLMNIKLYMIKIQI